jgi:hypothetical protein
MSGWAHSRLRRVEHTSTSSLRIVATPGDAAGRPQPRLMKGWAEPQGRRVPLNDKRRQVEHEVAAPEQLSSAGALHLMARRQLTVRRNDERLVLAPAMTRHFVLERVTGIEPALSAWEADVLPLNYTRERHHCTR